MSGIIAAMAIGGGLAVSAPARASGGGVSGGSVPPITATVSGASGPVTVAWTQRPGGWSGHPLTILNPNSLTTGFDFAGVGERETATARVRVTVTNGGNSAFAEVDVTFRNNETLVSRPGYGGGEIIQ